MFDADGNGSISRSEFCDFARFVVVLSYLHETNEGRELRALVREGGATAAPGGSQRMDKLLNLLREDRARIAAVVPYLPESLMAWLLGQEYAEQCCASFAALDADGNGSLDAEELYPVIIEVVGGYCADCVCFVDLDCCRRFISIFNPSGTGSITKAEFVDFARFLVTLSYLQTDEGQELLDQITLAVQSRRVSDLLERLTQDTKRGADVACLDMMPLLPEALRMWVTGEEFEKCFLEQFEALDTDGSGDLDAAELFPILVDMAKDVGAVPISITAEHCARLITVFNPEGSSTLNKYQFLSFARFLLIHRYLEASMDQPNHSKTPPCSATPSGQLETLSRPVSPTKGLGDEDLPSHLQVDVDFFRTRSEKLKTENDALHAKLYSMEEALRRAESRMEQQDNRLKHLEIAAGKK